MFGDDNNDNANGQAPEGPPPLVDTPMTSDQPAADPPASNPQPGTASDFAMAGNNNNPTPAQDEKKGRDSDLLSSGASGSDELLNIKQQALQQLSPLVNHLDQTPEEEFRTTMMMIQATDNQDLVKKAFDAAQKIEDDKKRAQAFLDIINEINYFTQQEQQ